MTSQAEAKEEGVETGHANGAVPSSRPNTVGFFHPELREVRWQVLYRWALTVLGLAIFILCVLSLYWAVLFRVEENLPALTTWIVDFDGQPPYNTTTPIVGPYITNAFQHTHFDTYDHLGWTIRSAADFNYDPMAVRQGVYDEHAYVAIIINANATALLRAAVNEGNSSYDPAGAAQVIYNTARDQGSMSSYILPALLDTLIPISSGFGAQWVSMLSANASHQDIFRVPQAVNPAIGWTLLDLRPFVPAVETPSVTIGLIYLIIISFFSFPFLMPVHSRFTQGKDHRPLHPLQLIAWRIVSNIIAYFFLSLIYSLVSLAFQIPFSNDPAPGTTPATNPNGYGKGSFVVYWMLNWVGMAALGLPSENMAMILGQPWSAMWLIFWVITNVSTGFYSLDLAPGFFAWGYAWPLHRIVEGSRTILFDTHSRIGLDFGILFVWVGASIVLYPFASLFMKWKMTRGSKK